MIRTRFSERFFTFAVCLAVSAVESRRLSKFRVAPHFVTIFGCIHMQLFSLGFLCFFKVTFWPKLLKFRFFALFVGVFLSNCYGVDFYFSFRYGHHDKFCDLMERNAGQIFVENHFVMQAS